MIVSCFRGVFSSTLVLDEQLLDTEEPSSPCDSSDDELDMQMRLFGPIKSRSGFGIWVSMAGWKDLAGRCWITFMGETTESRMRDFFEAEGGETSSMDGISVDGDRNCDLEGDVKKGLVGRGRSRCSLGRGMTTCIRGLLVEAALYERKPSEVEPLCLWPHSTLPWV